MTSPLMDMAALHDWMIASPSEFSVTDITNDKEDQFWYLRQLELMVGMGLIVRAGRRGWYRMVEIDAEEMDLDAATPEPVDMVLPFEMSDLAEVYEGNIIVIAGSKSSGKTTLCLNLIKDNEHKFDGIHYFNSEMGAPELKKRLGFFCRSWNFHAYSRSRDFGSVIKPGPNNLNIIDFLELGSAGSSFVDAADIIRGIHDALKGAICVVCMQKRADQDLPRGGELSIEKARLVLSMGKGSVKIYDAKNWVTETNPNGMKLDFKVVQGTKIMYRRDSNGKPAWYHDDDEGGMT